MRTLAIMTLLGSALALAPPAQAQRLPGRLRVYLDCRAHGCDFDHFRREIAFADWVRDREDAHVHVLVTVEPTGAGGRAYTLTFIGAAAFAGREHTVTYLAGATDTDAEVRDGLTRVLSLGLVPYALPYEDGERLRLTYAARDTLAAPAVTHDPWDYWTFRIRAGGFLRGEQQQRFRNLEGGVSASRVTDALKLEFATSAFYGRDEFDTEDSTLVSTQTRWGGFGLVGKSLGPHFTAGGVIEVGGVTFRNQDLSVWGGPALEYNVFPYSESTRRMLTVTAVVAPAYLDYADTTIFDRTSETRVQHFLAVKFTQRQPWGSAQVSAEWSQFWHDVDLHRLELESRVEVRIVRGLSFDLSSQVERVKDQIYLPRKDLTPEEVLLRRRELGTDYRYSVNFGLSYRFGSAFDNVVNPRFQ